MILIIFQPFISGDFIDVGGVMGTVGKINIFDTVMRSGDNRAITVPSGARYGGTIAN